MLFSYGLPVRKRICHGSAAVDRQTKRLIQRVRPGQIAVIHHRDLDEVAAEGLIKKRVGGVVNVAPSIGGTYPARGAGLLLEAGVPLLEDMGSEVLDQIVEGDELCIHRDRLYHKQSGTWVEVAQGLRLDPSHWQQKMEEATDHLDETLESFVDNTLDYAQRERSLVSRRLPIPSLITKMRGRDVVIVVRGGGYERDLQILRSYLREADPVLVGVDGGADALLECGFRPDLILGDMDSVSDSALLAGSELVVHAYPDGRAPGMNRVERLGLTAHLIPCPGTSEDVAMLMADQEGAQLIVAVGSHSHVIDFLEKGRKGMSSTLLTRIKVGPKLVDARGIHRLYSRSRKLPIKEMAGLTLASAFPILALTTVNPHLFYMARLMWLNVKILFSSWV
ncbi:putative membrane-anchored protein [Kroppenstedtia sanguinis]|uniref:putative cytokinetic ring protein SteA n=1 Tax=Kroppenstedtia sanguinis TaxID=1380684 RepID=UPI003D23731B